MPDDELDSGGNLVGTNPLDDYDEFLPSTSTNVEASEKTLSKLQDEDEDEEDEFASSLMAAAKGKLILLFKKLVKSYFCPIFLANHS